MGVPSVSRGSSVSDFLSFRFPPGSFLSRPPNVVFRLGCLFTRPNRASYRRRVVRRGRPSHSDRGRLSRLSIPPGSRSDLRVKGSFSKACHVARDFLLLPSSSASRSRAHALPPFGSLWPVAGVPSDPRATVRARFPAPRARPGSFLSRPSNVVFSSRPFLRSARTARPPGATSSGAGDPPGRIAAGLVGRRFARAPPGQSVAWKKIGDFKIASRT